MPALHQLRGLPRQLGGTRGGPSPTLRRGAWIIDVQALLGGWDAVRIG